MQMLNLIIIIPACNGGMVVVYKEKKLCYNEGAGFKFPPFLLGGHVFPGDLEKFEALFFSQQKKKCPMARAPAPNIFVQKMTLATGRV